jgi:hypothetical protein
MLFGRRFVSKTIMPPQADNATLSITTAANAMHRAREPFSAIGATPQPSLFVAPVVVPAGEPRVADSEYGQPSSDQGEHVPYGLRMPSRGALAMKTATIVAVAGPVADRKRF